MNSPGCSLPAVGESAPLTLAPITPGERIVALDVLRGFALLGIALMNIEWFSRPIQELGSGLPAGAGALDQAAGWLIYVFVQGKFWALFSLLFGIGFAVMAERAQAAGRPFIAPYLRRTAVLLGLGIAHALLLWVGDILHSYALAALAVLVMFRNARPAELLTWAGLIYLLLWLVMLMPAALLAVAPGALQPDSAALTVQLERHADTIRHAATVYASGDWGAVTALRAREFAALLDNNIFVVPAAMSFFLLGGWLYRSGRIRAPGEHLAFFRRLALFALPLGAALALASAAIATTMDYPLPSARQFLAMAVMWPADAILMLGYVGALVLLLQRARVGAWLRRWLAPAGRMALTNYLLQSLIAGSLFYGYGLGLWGQVPRAAQVALVAVIFALQCLLSRCWLTLFRYGPLEWLWRGITYLKLPPLRA